VTKKYNVSITQNAQQDLEQIYYYIAENNPKNAADFIVELEKKVDLLSLFPQRHPLIRENEFYGTEYRHLIYKDYRVIYRIAGDSVYILRVFHGSKLFDE